MSHNIPLNATLLITFTTFKEVLGLILRRNPAGIGCERDTELVGKSGKGIFEKTIWNYDFWRMKITRAEFLTSSARISQCPPPKKPEYAFIGRSNVGKSSLINMLCSNKNLAKTSGRPGKTQLINHFTINEHWYLVDLPGYGYAKVSQKARGKFQKLIMDYIEKRESLINLFVLIDSRLEPQLIDLEFMEWLGENEVPFSIVFTKTDKIGSTQVQSNVAAYRRKMLESWEEFPKYFITSAEKFIGKEDLLEYIDELNHQFGKENLFAE